MCTPNVYSKAITVISRKILLMSFVSRNLAQNAKCECVHHHKTYTETPDGWTANTQMECDPSRWRRNEGGWKTNIAMLNIVTSRFLCTTRCPYGVVRWSSTAALNGFEALTRVVVKHGRHVTHTVNSGAAIIRRVWVMQPFRPETVLEKAELSWSPKDYKQNFTIFKNI